MVSVPPARFTEAGGWVSHTRDIKNFVRRKDGNGKEVILGRFVDHVSVKGRDWDALNRAATKKVADMEKQLGCKLRYALAGVDHSLRLESNRDHRDEMVREVFIVYAPGDPSQSRQSELDRFKKE